MCDSFIFDNVFFSGLNVGTTQNKSVLMRPTLTRDETQLKV